MGSRKKKAPVLKQNSRFWQIYKQLNIHQRIAFKQFWMCWGRMRVQLYEFNQVPLVFRCGPLAVEQCVRDGYTWLFTCMRPFSDESKAYFESQQGPTVKNLMKMY